MEFIPKNPVLEFKPDSLEVIRNMYNLGNGRMTQSVDILEHWVKKQAHFVNKSYSRHYLETSIISCKGSVEKAKMQIDKLCTFKTLLPKFFICEGIKETISDFNKVAYVVHLPKITKDYERIFFVQINDKELTSAHLFDYYRISLAFAEYIKEHDYVNGFVIVMDLRDANLLNLVTKMNIVELRQFMTILTEGYAARLKGIHMITQSKTIEMLVKMIKSVLSEKLGNRIYVHEDLEDLYQVVEKDLLPIDFGGKIRSLKEVQDAWKETLGSPENEMYLARMKASHTDESLRQTDQFNEQYMGLPGSFRTLTVD